MIDDLRDEIDRIDEKIIRLISRRADQAMKIGRHKIKEGLDITDRDREKVVLNRVKELNEGPFEDEQVERIYGRIISETKELQVEVDADDCSNEARSN